MFLRQEDMSKKKNPRVFLDASIDRDPVEQIVIEVRKNCGTLPCWIL